MIEKEKKDAKNEKEKKDGLLYHHRQHQELVLSLSLFSNECNLTQTDWLYCH